MPVIHRFTGTPSQPSWSDVEHHVYQEAETAGATRSVLIGPDDGAGNFVVRYYEIPPDGKSHLDTHEHDHGVYIVRGRARLESIDGTHELGPGDVVYIPPFEQHQFINDSDSVFGFICVIPPPKEDTS